MSDFGSGTTYRIWESGSTRLRFIFVLEDWGLGSALLSLLQKLSADGDALKPTSHDCEDDECVDGSAISSVTVLVMCMFKFRTSKIIRTIIVFEGKHWLEPLVVHMCSCSEKNSEVTEVLLGAHGTRVSLASFPGPLMELLSAGWGLGNEAINYLNCSRGCLI